MESELLLEQFHLFRHSRDCFFAFRGKELLRCNPAAEQLLESVPSAALLADLTAPDFRREINGTMYHVQSIRPNDTLLILCLSAVQAESTELTRLCTTLRTDLATQRGAMTRLLSPLQELAPDEKKRALQSVYRSHYRIRRSVETGAAFAALRAGELPCRPAPLELNGFCEELCTTLIELCGKHCAHLQWNPPDSLLWVNTDKALLEQLLLRLYSNSLRHTPPEGNICLTLRRKETAVFLSLTDTGEGADPAQLHIDLQEPLEKHLSRLAEGMGLGLAVARQLAQLLGGSLSLESALGKGCRAWLQLPLLEAKPFPRSQFRTPAVGYRPQGYDAFLTELSTALPLDCYNAAFVL